MIPACLPQVVQALVREDSAVPYLSVRSVAPVNIPAVATAGEQAPRGGCDQTRRGRLCGAVPPFALLPPPRHQLELPDVELGKPQRAAVVGRVLDEIEVVA